jgi:hypothetical protein
MQNFALFILISLFVVNHSFGQIIALSHDTIYLQEMDVDLGQSFNTFNIDVGVTNLTDETIDLKWTRSVSENCPEPWFTTISDNNISYTPNVSTNIMPNSGFAFQLDPNETYDYFAITYYIEDVPGCCPVKIDFSLVDDPDNILATFHSFFKVNTEEDCNDFILTSVEYPTSSSLKIFPNPARDMIYFSEPMLDQEVSIVDMLGRTLLNTNIVGTNMDIASLTNGVYWIMVRDDQQKIVQYAKLVKE